jgi:hypothetical protein
MRLYPPISEAEAESALKAQAASLYGEEAAAGMAAEIAALAKAMAVIGAVDLPDTLEPLLP